MCGGGGQVKFIVVSRGGGHYIYILLGGGHPQFGYWIKILAGPL